MVTREYCEKIICQQIRFYRLYENFLERRKLPKLTQEEIEHVNRSISTKEPWVSYRLSLKKKIPTKESPEPKSFTGELYQMFKEELTMFHKLLKKKKKRREQFPNHWMRPGLPWYEKQRHHKKRILQNISYDYVFKSPQ